MTRDMWFGKDRGLKIFPQRMTQSINELINHGGVCRTAPAIPGLLNTEAGRQMVILQSLCQQTIGASQS